jgi:hypothetical protein
MFSCARYPPFVIPQRLGPPDAPPWIGISGELRQGDDEALADLLDDPPGFANPVLDIRNLDTLDDEGCEVLRTLMDRVMQAKSTRKLTVIRPWEGPVAEKVESSGLADDWRFDWSEGTPPGLP